jgi:hypothetical protein
MKQPCQRILRASPTTVRRLASQVKQPVVSHDFCHCALCFEDLIKLQVNFLLCLVSLVFNSTFYNISVISRLSVFYVEESRVSWQNWSHKVISNTPFPGLESNLHKLYWCFALIAVTTHINNVRDCCNNGTNNKSMYLDNVTVEKSSRFKIIQNSLFLWFWNSQSANM